MRRYEIDSIRSIALLFLIFYHIIISFLPETKAIFFIVNNQKDIVIDWLLVLSSSLNIWRIPILFFIGGMAISFSSKRRKTGELIKERFKRIMLPLIFCSFFPSLALSRSGLRVFFSAIKHPEYIILKH